MKTILWILLLLISSKEMIAQVTIPSKRTYTYTKDTVNYYFYLQSSADQSLTWGYIYGSEKCFVHIVNNTNDTLSLGRVGVTSHPIYWFLEGTRQNELLAPNDTIHLTAHLARRHGDFSRSITIQYQSVSIPGKLQSLSIPTKGYFVDSIGMKHNPNLKLPNESYERREYLSTHYENGQVKEVYNSNPANDSIPIKISYYENGQVKEVNNTNQTNDTVPIIISYYENGKTKEINYKRKGIVKKAYDVDGNLKNIWEDNGNHTEYYTNGNTKFKSGQDHNSATEPFESFYYENGCLKKEVYLNNSITKEYDSINCNLLLYKTIRDNTNNTNSVAYYEGNKITKIVFYAYTNSKERVEHIGTFDGHQIKNGFVNYYSSKGSLIFSSQIKDGKRDAILNTNEKQGNQINLHDELGRKTGLWIMQKTNDTVPIAIPSDLNNTSIDVSNYAWRNYIYDKGDTATIIYLDDYGGIKSKVYLKDKAYRILQGKETGIGYHENGFLNYKSYIIKNGTEVTVEYSETKENEIIGGRKGNNSELIYSKNKLVEIRSKLVETPPQLDFESTSDEGTSITTLRDGMSVVEKGIFKNFELDNGFIYYYDKGDNRLLTEKVEQGIIQGNPRINLTDEYLLAIAKRNDLNMNSWVEAREVKNLTSITLTIPEKELESFKWLELNHFKKLQVIQCNGLAYRMSDYSNLTLLKNAIIAKKGTAINRDRYRYDREPIPGPGPIPEPIHDQVVDFPDVEAKFPGGNTALFHWIDSNLVCPDVSIEMSQQGKVYVEFVIEQDGSISDVKVMKGVCKEYDQEAKRLIRSMPRWEPAIFKDSPCASRMRLPILFRLK